MRFFKFLKKKKQIINEDLEYNNINNFLEEKQAQIKEDESRVLNLIKQRIITLISKLKEQIGVLENINLDEKKEQPRLKKTTLEGLEVFKQKLNELIQNLEKLKDEDFNELYSNLNQIFADFKKNSKLSLEKATILIGKELADIEDTLSNFTHNFNLILKENKEFIELYSSINQIKITLEKINNNNIQKNYLKQEINSLKNKELDNNKKIQEINDKLNEIKNSKEYKEELNKEKILNQKNSKLKNEIVSLKKLIDFKKLANIHHSIEKDMNLILNYKNNFFDTFNQDQGEFLIKNIKDNTQIKEKINQISELKNQLSKIQINKINLNTYDEQINELKKENSELNKNQDKIKQKQQEIDKIIYDLKQNLIKDFKKININLKID